MHRFCYGEYKYNSMASNGYEQKIRLSFFRVSMVKPSMPEYPKEESSVLLLRIRDGDASAFQILFDRYYFRVAGFIRKYVDSADIEDVAQEVFLSVFQRLEKMQNITAFEHYLFRSAKNRCFNWLRRKRRLREWIKLYLYAATFWHDANGHCEQERLFSLKGLLAMLSEEDRRYLQLFYMQKRSRSEIAEIAKESPSTVYRKIASARAALLQIASEQGFYVTFSGRHDMQIQELQVSETK